MNGLNELAPIKEVETEAQKKEFVEKASSDATPGDSGIYSEVYSDSSEVVMAFVSACDAATDTLRPKAPTPEDNENRQPPEKPAEVFTLWESDDKFGTAAEYEDLANACPHWKSKKKL